jgi:hypothetical protein
MSSEFTLTKRDDGATVLVKADFGPTPPDPITIPNNVVEVASGALANVSSKEVILPASVSDVYTDSFSQMSTILIKSPTGIPFILKVIQSKQNLGNGIGLLSITGSGPNVFKNGLKVEDNQGYSIISGTIIKNGVYNVVVTDINSLAIHITIAAFPKSSLIIPSSDKPVEVPDYANVSSDIVVNLDPQRFPRKAILAFFILVLLIVYLIVSS